MYFHVLNSIEFIHCVCKQSICLPNKHRTSSLWFWAAFAWLSDSSFQTLVFHTYMATQHKQLQFDHIFASFRKSYRPRSRHFHSTQINMQFIWKLFIRLKSHLRASRFHSVFGQILHAEQHRTRDLQRISFYALCFEAIATTLPISSLPDEFIASGMLVQANEQLSSNCNLFMIRWPQK